MGDLSACQCPASFVLLTGPSDLMNLSANLASGMIEGRPDANDGLYLTHPTSTVFVNMTKLAVHFDNFFVVKRCSRPDSILDFLLLLMWRMIGFHFFLHLSV